MVPVLSRVLCISTISFILEGDLDTFDVDAFGLSMNKSKSDWYSEQNQIFKLTKMDRVALKLKHYQTVLSTMILYSKLPRRRNVEEKIKNGAAYVYIVQTCSKMFRKT